MATVEYQLQFHLAHAKVHSLTKSLKQLRSQLPQVRTLHQFNLSSAEAQERFRSAYDRLDRASSQLLRSLGLLGKDEFSAEIVPILLECDPATAAAALHRLVTSKLVEQASPGYCFAHDLIRQMARQQLAIEESSQMRRTLRLRVSRWYLDLVQQMNACLDPTLRLQIALADRRRDTFGLFDRAKSSRSGYKTLSKQYEDVAQQLLLVILNWFEREKLHLIAAVEWAHQVRDWELTVQLTQALVRFFDLQNDWVNWEQTHRLALDAAHGLGDSLQVAQVLNSLGNAYVRQGQWNRAKVRYDRSLEICREHSATYQEAQTLINLGIVHRMQNQPEQAFSLWSRAIELLPQTVLEREKLNQWLQLPVCLSLQTAANEFDIFANSHQTLSVVSGVIKWLLHPSEFH